LKLIDLYACVWLQRKFQVETEVENWIQKFDADMGERQVIETV